MSKDHNYAIVSSSKSNHCPQLAYVLLEVAE